MSRDHIGVLAALASSAVGGVAGGATRFVIHATDPVTLGVFRFGTGFVILLPIALLMKCSWPKGRDWIAVALLGILFFFAFSVLFNLAYDYTTAARGALTLSTMPLMTLVVGAALGIERISARKTFGVLLAMAGVFSGADAWVVGRAKRRLARRTDHARSYVLHVALQCVVATVYFTFRSSRLSHRRHGCRGTMPAGVGDVDPRL
jgi:drug/metabolite transporter (DMT)-like permease